MIKEYTVEVKSIVRVKVDLDNFTDKFMKDFRDKYLYFTTVEEHVEHLAQNFVHGHIQSNDDYVLGYGRLDGVEFNMMNWESEIIEGEKEDVTRNVD